MNYLAQIIGLVAVLLWIYSIQHQKQTKILFYQFLANLAYAVQFATLKAFSASTMNLVSCLRCLIFYNYRKNRQDIPKLWLVFFLILIIILGGIAYSNPLSLIPIVITMFYTVSSWYKKTKWLRIVFIGAACLWIFYNFQVGAYVTMFGNILEIISGTISLIRFPKD